MIMENDISWWYGKVGCDLEEGSEDTMALKAHIMPLLGAWIIPTSEFSHFISQQIFLLSERNICIHNYHVFKYMIHQA